MRGAGTNKGFSTLEVLTAVAIVVILAMILLGVGRRLKTQADEKLAQSTIEILVTAISQYHQFWDEFPTTDPCTLPVKHSEDLYRQLYSTPDSRRLCEQIQATQIGDTNNDEENRLEFLDPWGNPLDYRYSEGDSFPVVESGGADGVIGTTGDNISSR
jgi:prepilin-type N-terminal cleavage/methylation domain-containing protein